MGKIVVSCDRWLGLGSKYVVCVDGREVGRLGRRTKTVRVDLPAGTYTVLVAYNGNETPVQSLDLGVADEVQFTLDFGSVGAAAASNALMPWKKRIAQPIGVTPSGFMVLNRTN